MGRGYGKEHTIMSNNGGTLEKFAGSLGQLIQQEYHIGEEYYRGDVKRGLRNSDGTGVLAGVSKVGSVQGYFIQDGQRIPKPGQLYYRGIELNEIVEAHRKAGTFGYEEVAYLLLLGYLPSKTELQYFNCSNYRGNRGTCNQTHYIRVDALEQVMLLEIRRLTAFLQDKEEDFVKLLMAKTLEVAERESARRAEELRANLARCAELDGLFSKTYEDNASGKLSDERFMMLTKRYDDEQLILKKKISALRAEIDKDKKSRMNAASFLRLVRKYTDIQELTPLVLHEMVKKIVVHQAQGTGKNRTQQLDIHYNFIGVLDMPEVASLPSSVTIDTRQGVAVEYITRKAG